MAQFQFQGVSLQALGSGALWWPDQRLLVVSDMHLAKSDRIARRRGALLPPYETAETLSRLQADLTATRPARVICLGDSFDDDLGETALSDDARHALAQMVANHDWTWISGNHDPAPKTLGGQSADTLTCGPLTFRHIAVADGAACGEVSGHYHPKLRLQTRAGTVSRPAFIWDETRLILPAYGAYTGGLDVSAAPLRDLFDPAAKAILTGPKPTVVPAFGPRRPSRRLGASTGQRPRLQGGNCG